jgi:hypothetical protein
VPDVATVPAGESPVIDNLGVHNHFDEHVKERDDLKVLDSVAERSFSFLDCVKVFVKPMAQPILCSSREL